MREVTRGPRVGSGLRATSDGQVLVLAQGDQVGATGRNHCELVLVRFDQTITSLVKKYQCIEL
jgi:hypothetical protein